MGLVEGSEEGRRGEIVKRRIAGGVLAGCRSEKMTVSGYKVKK